MIWSPEQDRALSKIQRWDPETQQVFKLFGYAGTGKSTLASHIGETWGGRIGYACFTGKAASNLVKMGAPARTIHSWIYVPAGKSKKRLDELTEKYEELTMMEEPEDSDHSEFVFGELSKLKEEIQEEEDNLRRPLFHLNLESDIKNLSLLIVDECSMISESMARDLMSFGRPILVMGDPAQLPPVKGKAYWMSDPDAMLTEIHRQAADNPIIQLSMDIRNGLGLRPMSNEFITIKPMSEKLASDYMDADQIIVGKNDTKRIINSRIREKRGITAPFPIEGEKVICLSNNNEEGVLNGELFELTADSEKIGDYVYLPLVHKTVAAHAGLFLGEEIPYYNLREANQFDFGYAITAHKCQGSQWPKILIRDESYVFRNIRKQWLYTAVTRAENSLTILT